VNCKAELLPNFKYDHDEDIICEDCGGKDTIVYQATLTGYICLKCYRLKVKTLCDDDKIEIIHAVMSDKHFPQLARA